MVRSAQADGGCEARAGSETADSSRKVGEKEPREERVGMRRGGESEAFGGDLDEFPDEAQDFRVVEDFEADSRKKHFFSKVKFTKSKMKHCKHSFLLIIMNRWCGKE